MTVALMFIFLASWCHVGSAYPNKVAYTIESFTFDGNQCMTDCDNGQCWVTHNHFENCVPGWKKSLTFYTTRYKHPSISKCLSSCLYGGYDYSWCYIDNDYNWDYCNPDSDDRTKWHQYTSNKFWCKDECSTHGNSYLWCYTYSGPGAWDFCGKTSFYQEQAKTIYGEDCYGNCAMHDGSKYYSCYGNKQGAISGEGVGELCAPVAVRYVCPNTLTRIRTTRATNPPRPTVEDYSNDIDNNRIPNLSTVELSSRNYPVLDNPVLDYTYQTLSSGLRLPTRIRARILPRPNYQHLRGTNTRSSSDISSEARANCIQLGINRCELNGNNDQLGHLIPYILGGPADWYNIVPQTRRINTGTLTNTDLGAPSVWSATERTMRRWVEDGGSVEYEVLVAYDLPTTRPSGFGTRERFYTPAGTLEYTCSGYWYSNDPNEDPDDWNNH